MKKVLIALDYAPSATKVAEQGFTMAKAMGAEIVLLHVLKDLVAYSMTYLNLTPLLLDGDSDLKNVSQQLLDRTKVHLGDTKIRTIVKEGEFAQTILDTATELEVDIIVLGSHSTKWLENILLGSVATEVLHKSIIPLYIIPTKKN